MDFLRSVQSVKDTVLPRVGRIPPEVLPLIPDFWDKYDGDQHVIASNHVCQAWKIFTSSSYLWTNLDCIDAKETHFHLEPFESSIHLLLSRDGDLCNASDFRVRRHPHCARISGAVQRLEDQTAEPSQ